jgi:acetate---CoA ligase (ADP-forming)
MTTARDLRPLFDPRSVAVVGASDDPMKWGYGLARGALRGSARRPVFLVNRKGGEVLGQRAYSSISELPEQPELVVVAVPEAGFEAAVDDALGAGAAAIVGITAGLGEQGEAGLAREQAVVERVRSAGAVLLGPNCLGVYDASSELDIGWSELPAGEIGLVSQSGNLALELSLIAGRNGLGFSRFASLGNQADLEATDLVSALASHEATRVIALYVEDFRDGRAFAGACHEAVLAGKPVVLLAAGRSEAAGRAAQSHTGALVSGHVAVEAACRAAGIEAVATPKQLVDIAQALLARDRPRGRRTVVFGDGGGHCVIAADLASAAGLEVPALPAELAGRLEALLGPTAVTGNPVDFAGAGEREIRRFADVAELLLAFPGVDAALLTGYFGGYASYGPEYEAQETEAATAMARAAHAAGKPLIVQTMYPGGPAAAAFRAARAPVYGETEAAVAALACLALRGEHSPRGVPALSAGHVRPLLDADAFRGGGGYFEARDLLERGGVPFARARRVATPAEAAAAAAELGYPVVLKAVDLLHKSDAGGVAVGIGCEEALELVFSDMATRLSAAEYSVERMAPVADGIELIVGARRDRRFGPIALVGLGGLYAELLQDVAVALAPIGADLGEELIRSLRGAPLLLGARGRPEVDVAAAARALAALSQVAQTYPEIEEIEVNPLLVTPTGVLGLDARILLATEGESDAC